MSALVRPDAIAVRWAATLALGVVACGAAAAVAGTGTGPPVLAGDDLDRPPAPSDGWRPEQPSPGCGHRFDVTDVAPALALRAAEGRSSVAGIGVGRPDPPSTRVQVFAVRLQEPRHYRDAGLEVVLGAEADRTAAVETNRLTGRVSVLDAGGRVVAAHPYGLAINLVATGKELERRRPSVLKIVGLWGCDLRPGVPAGAAYVHIEAGSDDPSPALSPWPAAEPV